MKVTQILLHVLQFIKFYQISPQIFGELQWWQVLEQAEDWIQG